jgi:hypothetical protein
MPLTLFPKPTAIPEPRILIAEKDALKGLVGIRLVVGDISREDAQWGMGQAEVRALVERKLRTAGIRVFTPSESESPIGMLYVKVDVLSSENQNMPILVYVFDCELSRFVAVNPYAKDHIDLALATVWKARGKIRLRWTPAVCGSDAQSIGGGSRRLRRCFPGGKQQMSIHRDG